jgi:hypothetical protein
LIFAVRQRDSVVGWQNAAQAADDSLTGLAFWVLLRSSLLSLREPGGRRPTMKKTTPLTLASLAVGVFALASCVMPSTTGTHSLGTSTSSDWSGSGSEAVTTTTVAEVPPRATDFTLNVVETQRDCFGSAGCNVQYRIVPTYVGMGSVPKGSYTLLYAVSGLSDSKTGNIAVSNGRFSTESGFGSSEQGNTLTASVTQVLED